MARSSNLVKFQCMSWGQFFGISKTAWKEPARMALQAQIERYQRRMQLRRPVMIHLPAGKVVAPINDEYFHIFFPYITFKRTPSQGHNFMAANSSKFYRKIVYEKFISPDFNLSESYFARSLLQKFSTLFKFTGKNV